jgi:hypothetical protein
MVRLLLIGPDWLWHPLGQCTPASSNAHIAAHEIVRCKSYNLWSGIVSDIGEITLVTAALTLIFTMFRAHNCSVSSPRFCWRFGHPVVGTSFKACTKHHPGKWRKEDGLVTAAHIDCAHKEAAAPK